MSRPATQATLYRKLSTAANCSRPTHELSMKYRPLGRTGVELGHTALGYAAVPMACANAIGDRLSDRAQVGY